MVKFQCILALWALSLGAAKAYGGRDALGAITFYLVSYFTTQLFVMTGKVYVLLRVTPCYLYLVPCSTHKCFKWVSCLDPLCINGHGWSYYTRWKTCCLRITRLQSPITLRLFSGSFVE